VVEKGTHAELMARVGGRYREMARLQRLEG
jgi:ABC-type multidrug transport system fused ATPase/permease subunit